MRSSQFLGLALNILFHVNVSCLEKEYERTIEVGSRSRTRSSSSSSRRRRRSGSGSGSSSRCRGGGSLLGSTASTGSTGSGDLAWPPVRSQCVECFSQRAIHPIPGLPSTSAFGGCSGGGLRLKLL